MEQASLEDVKEFKKLTEAEKVDAHRVDDTGPYFVYNGYKITLDQLSAIE
jgi:hypothetical protein